MQVLTPMGSGSSGPVALMWGFSAAAGDASCWNYAWKTVHKVDFVYAALAENMKIEEVN